MMIRLFLLFTILLFFAYACTRSIYESAIDNNTGKSIAGYNNKEILFNRQALTKDSLSTDSLRAWGDKGITIEFSYEPPYKIASVVLLSDRYSTVKGLSPGDDVSKARKLYGKPCTDKVVDFEIGNDPSYWFSGLFYENFMVGYDSSTMKIKMIEIGKDQVTENGCRCFRRK